MGIRRVFVLGSLAAHAHGAAVAPTQNLVQGICATGYEEGDTELDFFPAKTNLGAKFQTTISADYSLLWQVSYHGSYKLLRNTQTGAEHVLYQCGTPMPNVTGATMWQVPVTRAATTSTTYLPFFEMIGERESLVAYTQSVDYVTSECFLKQHRDGALAIAYDAASWGADNALLEELGVELTVADSWSASAYNAYVMTDTAEDSVLKIAEYVELVALFFNREAEATRVITQMVENFYCAKKKAALLRGSAPVAVMWTQYYDGTWSSAKCPSWYCEIIEAAGGVVVVPEDYGIVGAVERWGTLYLTNDQVAELAAHAEVWISPGAFGAPTFDLETDAAFASIKALVADGGALHGRVFDNQGANGANDWFERRVVEPDGLLLDVAKVLHPDSPTFADHERVWLRDVATETSSSALVAARDLDAACPDVLAAYDFAASPVCEEDHDHDHEEDHDDDHEEDHDHDHEEDHKVIPEEDGAATHSLALVALSLFAAALSAVFLAN